MRRYEHLLRTYEHLLRTYEELVLATCDRLFTLCCEKFDLGLWCMRIIELCLAVYYKYSSSCVLIAVLYKVNLSGINLIDFVEKTDLRVSTRHNEREKNHVNQNKRANLSSISRSRSPNKSKHDKKRDREPSGVPVKKLVNMMFKNRTCRCKIEALVNRLIPKSSAWHNLLSTRYRKNIFHKQIKEWQFWNSPCCARKVCKAVSKKRYINVTKITSNDKCDIQRFNTSVKYSLFICGDIELNMPGPEYNSMSLLTTRLARIGRRPVNIVGDGNCFFRSVSHQIYQTENYHAQIRALAIQHLLYNNYSKTRNLIGQYPCRMRQSCTGYLKVDIASHFTSLLRA